MKNELHDFVVNNITEDDTDEEADLEREFIDLYESEWCDTGDWALITDLLNLRHPNMTFRHDDCCLFVGAYFPMDEEAKRNMPTAGDIQNAVNEFVNNDTAKIENGKLEFDYYTIDDYS